MVEMMVTSSALIGAVLLLRKLTKGKISMRFRYALWLIVALRLMLPVSVASSPISVMNLFPKELRSAGRGMDAWADFAADAQTGKKSGAQAAERSDALSDGGSALHTEGSGGIAQAEGNGDIAQAEGSGGIAHTEGNSGGVHTDEKDSAQNSEDGSTQAGMGSVLAAAKYSRIYDMGAAVALRAVWLAGILVMAGSMLFGQIRLLRYLYRNRSRVPVTELPGEWAGRFAAHKMSVWRLKGLPSPCLVGKSVYVSPQILKESDKLEHVLAHEYCHARQHDTVWAFLRSALVAVYWFHPLVWAAAYASKQDGELSCDEWAIWLVGEEQRFSYGKTLLYLISDGRERFRYSGIVMTMEDKESRMRERIAMIVKDKKNRKGAAAAVLAVSLLACGCAFTGAQDEAEDEAQAVAAQGNTDDSEVMEEALQAQREELEALQAQQEELEALKRQLQQELEELEKAKAERQAQQELTASSAREEAFSAMLYGMDDTQLEKEETVDYQGYVQYEYGLDENPMQDGHWYLLHKEVNANIAFYGLYTEEYGFRGLKTLIGGDVNTFDVSWMPQGMPWSVQVLEYAEDGLPRSFAFEICVENTSDSEIRKLYVADRYDTGHLDLYSFEQEDYWKQIKDMVKLELSDDGSEVYVIYEGDVVIGAIDTGLPELQGHTVKEAGWDENVTGYLLNNGKYVITSEGDSGYVMGEYAGQGSGAASEESGITLLAAIGLKLDGPDGIWWYDDLNLLSFPVDVGTFGSRSFTLGTPAIASGLVHNIPIPPELDAADASENTEDRIHPIADNRRG